MPRAVNLTALILARDEAGVLGLTLEALSDQCRGGVEIHVVADHCKDGTEAIARAYGARVHVRGLGAAGKGPALRWWLDRTRPAARPDAWVVVLDADSRPAPDLFAVLWERLACEEGGGPRGRAFQIRVEPALTSSGHLPRLAAHAELVEQRVNDRLRAALGWPVRLRGTGMVLPRALLDEVGGRLHTAVEDVELTLLLAARGVRIAPITETWVGDPKPDAAGVTRQRARWLKGQAQVAVSYAGLILRLVGRGPAGWSVLSSTLFKPRTLLYPLRLALALCAWGVALGTASAWLTAAAVALTFMPAADLLALLYGLRYSPDPSGTFRSLCLFPLYFAMWLRSFSLALTSQNHWLRARSKAAPSQPAELQRTTS